jgi:hypothetical protein
VDLRLLTFLSLSICFTRPIWRLPRGVVDLWSERTTVP